MIIKNFDIPSAFYPSPFTVGKKNHNNYKETLVKGSFNPSQPFTTFHHKREGW